MPLFSKKQPSEPQDIKEILAQFEELKKLCQDLRQEVENLKKKENLNLKKIGIIRFNPFSELGSNQSFSIAILNGKDNGVVITSLFSHDGNRVYGKPIQNGTSSFPLSDEEKQSINLAQQNKETNA